MIGDEGLPREVRRRYVAVVNRLSSWDERVRSLLRSATSLKVLPECARPSVVSRDQVVGISKTVSVSEAHSELDHWLDRDEASKRLWRMA